ncbi:hypothetical protein BKA81DRAFT_381050 [Phyllosticta paracitricarpa]
MSLTGPYEYLSTSSGRGTTISSDLHTIQSSVDMMATASPWNRAKAFEQLVENLHMVQNQTRSMSKSLGLQRMAEFNSNSLNEEAVLMALDECIDALSCILDGKPRGLLARGWSLIRGTNDKFAEAEEELGMFKKLLIFAAGAVITISKSHGDLAMYSDKFSELADKLADEQTMVAKQGDDKGLG